MDPERVRGMVWGAVAASAAGLKYTGTDPQNLWDLSVDDVAKKPGASNGRYPPGAWCALVEPVFVAMEAAEAAPAVAAVPGDRDVPVDVARKFVLEFAERYQDWSRNGVRSWHESNTPYEQDAHSQQVCTAARFLEQPMSVADKQPLLPTDNATIIRALFAAIMPSDQQAVQMAIFMCRVTHRGQPVLASTVLVTLLLQSLLFGGRDVRAIKFAAARAREFLQSGSIQRKRLFSALMCSQLENVGGPDHFGDHMSSVRCAVWAFRACLSAGADVSAERQRALFVKVVRDVASKGGAAGYHCAVAGAVVGAFYGESALPAWRSELGHADWVQSHVDDVVDLMFVRRPRAFKFVEEREREAALAAAGALPDAAGALPDAATYTDGPSDAPPETYNDDLADDLLSDWEAGI